MDMWSNQFAHGVAETNAYDIEEQKTRSLELVKKVWNFPHLALSPQRLCSNAVCTVMHCSTAGHGYWSLFTFAPLSTKTFKFVLHPGVQQQGWLTMDNLG